MKHFFIIIFFLSAFFTNAQKVSLQKAQQAATQFLGTSKVELSSFRIQKEGKDTLAYFFNSDKGFIMISGDRNIMPVLAYSPDTRYEAQQIAPAAEMWFNHYYSQIREVKSSKTFNVKAQEAWEHLLSGASSKVEEEEVRPFITSKWGQEDNYNFYCPRDLTGSFNGRAVTGCVATAMAQILYYFRFPESGIGSYQYEYENYGTISANFETAHYDYDAMTDEPTKINPAASLLIHHLGVAVDMKYGPKSSGMTNHKAAYALKTYFKLSPKTQYVFRDTTKLNWDSLIVTHLHQRIPLYYAGWSDTVYNNGHAFVCDGYKKTEIGYWYHFNFGWNGRSDAYFYTNSLRPGGYNFNLAQELIINAYPDTAHYSYPAPLQSGSKLLTSAAGSFENTINSDLVDFTWRIKPDLHNLTSIDFSLQYELAENDTIFISSNDPAVPDRMFTDSIGVFKRPYSDEIHVRFLRHNTEKQSVFKGNYNSAYPTYCGGFIPPFTSSGTSVSDGSGEENYNNCTRCKYNVFLRDSKAITIKFTQFETEPNEDILYIYDNSGNKLTLLEALSGTLTDTVLTFHTDRLQFIFETSATNTFPGWEFIFYDSSDILENADSEWRVYPNPSTGIFYLQTTGSINQPYMAKIFTLDSKYLFSVPVMQSQTELNLSSFPSGSYIVQLFSRQTMVKKFILVNQ